MEYLLEINFCTDGDFGFGYIPREMKYDGDEGYYLTRTFKDKDTAIKTALNYCDFFKNNLFCDRNYVVNDFNEMIDNFIKGLEVPDFLYSHGYMRDGNYEGTEISLKTIQHLYNLNFLVTDEEREILNNCSLTCGEVKDIILKLAKEKQYLKDI